MEKTTIVRFGKPGLLYGYSHYHPFTGESLDVPIASDAVMEEFIHCMEVICSTTPTEVLTYLTNPNNIGSTTTTWSVAIDKLVTEKSMEPCIECVLLSHESDSSESIHSWSAQYKENRKPPPLSVLYVLALRCERALNGTYAKQITERERLHQLEARAKYQYMWRDTYTHVLVRELKRIIHLVNVQVLRTYAPCLCRLL
jgi:hypothetical protein